MSRERGQLIVNIDNPKDYFKTDPGEENRRNSASVTLCGINWQLAAHREESADGPRVYLTVSAAREGEDWRCKATCVSRIRCSSLNGAVSQFFHEFSKANPTHGDWLCSLDNLLMPSRGYVCNNAVTFICSIVASKPAQCEAALDGIRGIKRRSTDFKILVGDREFYVNRGLLATHCEYFDGLFYGNYGERHRDEIHLDDVDADDSEKFMRLIVPPQEPISGINIDAVMPLAHRFVARTIVEQCEQLIVNKVTNLARSVPILDKCGMTDMIECLFEGVHDSELRVLTDDEVLSELSSATKAVIIKELMRRRRMH